MSTIPSPEHSTSAPQDLINSVLFRIVRNAADLVRADGGTISATNLRSGETYDFSCGSSYRHPGDSLSGVSSHAHTRVDVTGAKKAWSPSLPLRSDGVRGALWLYRQAAGDNPAEFTAEDKRAVRIVLDTAALALEQAMEVTRLQDLLHWAGVNTVKAMIHAIRAKDPYTSDHCQRVADHSTRIAEHLGVDGVQQVWAAASVHDVGKIGLLDSILEKPGHLERNEMAAVQQHPRWGGEIVRHFTDEWDLAPGVSSHHEWTDGRGYPDGLKGDEIPLTGRIITIADAYDAMTTDRPYRRALNTRTALDRLSAGAGIQFDPQIVAIARECLN